MPGGLDPSGLAKSAPYLALGFEFAGIVVTGVVVGSYIDGHVGSTPLFTLLLTLGGMVGALYRLILSLNKLKVDPNDRSGSDR